MPTIRKRNGRFQAQARKTGYKPQSKSFDTKSEAVKWATITELTLEPLNAVSSRKDTLRDLILDYLKFVSPSKTFHRQNVISASHFLQFPFVDIPIESISRADLESFREQRLRVVKTSTVAWNMSFLKIVLRHYNKPCIAAELPKLRLPQSRTRRLELGELEALLSVPARTQEMNHCILLAIETGMRRSELLAVQWEHIDFQKSLLTIPHTKTGYSRCIPLTPKASQILQGIPKESSRVFSRSISAFALAWYKRREKAIRTCPTLATLTFHDLRHEAISRFFELGLNVPEVALISGHRTPSHLFRYTHIRPEHVASKLLTLQGASA